MTHTARPTELPARDGTYVLGPSTSARRSIYSVLDRRDGQLLLRLVGLLCRPGIVLVRDQALPEEIWLSAEPFVAFDMRSAVLTYDTIVEDLADDDVFSLDNGNTWYPFAVPGFGTVSVYTDDRRDDDAPLVRVAADPDQECIVLLDAPCLYDADGDDLVCGQAAEHVVVYRNGSYGPFVAPVCPGHLLSTRGRVQLGSGGDVRTVDLRCAT